MPIRIPNDLPARKVLGKPPSKISFVRIVRRSRSDQA
jgi:hypothetical protein